LEDQTIITGNSTALAGIPADQIELAVLWPAQTLLGSERGQKNRANAESEWRATDGANRTALNNGGLPFRLAAIAVPSNAGHHNGRK
jgi:hypothetical protein